MKRYRWAALVVGCCLTAGCFSLDVDAIQPTGGGVQFTRDSVLKDPAIAARAIGSSFISFWSGVNAEHPNTVLGALGEELTSSVGTYSTPFFIHVSEPRVQFDNEVTATSRLARDPWGFFYEGNSASAELGGHLKRSGQRVIDPATERDITHQVLTFAKWQMGMAHSYLGILFDSGAIVNEDTDITVSLPLPLRSYQEVIDSGIKWLEEAIVLTEQESFTIPLNENIWVFGRGITSVEMGQVAHSIIARTLAFQFRHPPEEYAGQPVAEIVGAPDMQALWTRIKFHAERGVQGPFGPQGDSNNSFISFLYKRAVTSAAGTANSVCVFNGTNVCGGGAGGYFRVDNRLVGPADTSGAYQIWLEQAAHPVDFGKARPFDVLTKDVRIQEPNGLDPDQTVPTYFKHSGGMGTVTLWAPQNRIDTNLNGPGNGLYYMSFYWNSTRALDNRTQWPSTGGGQSRDSEGNDLHRIIDEMLGKPEMDLLRAEAEYRLGNFQAAADLVNISRVGNGGLPAVTTAGAPHSPGSTRDCVPKIWDGSCGSLWDALLYEKRIETYGTGIAFYDARRWGCLLEGTWTQLPVPGQQLNLYGDKPVYTYGGADRVGSFGTASKPTNCPLMYKP